MVNWIPTPPGAASSILWDPVLMILPQTYRNSAVSFLERASCSEREKRFSIWSFKTLISINHGELQSGVSMIPVKTPSPAIVWQATNRRGRICAYSQTSFASQLASADNNQCPRCIYLLTKSLTGTKCSVWSLLFRPSHLQCSLSTSQAGNLS